MLYVESRHEQLVREQCAAYDLEQVKDTVREEYAGPVGSQSIVSLLLYALLLSAMFVFTDARMLEIGRGSEAAIWRGELWRVITSLTLHADWPHMAGNMAAGILLAILLFHFIGYGAGWLFILLSGSLGNLLNAWTHAGRGHASIGASTAVFGTLGLVVGLSISRQWRQVATRRPRKFWTPLVGGIVLLGMLGTGGGRTDVTAHLFGFAVGAVTGGVLGVFEADEKIAVMPPWLFWLPAIALVAVAWIAARVFGTA